MTRKSLREILISCQSIEKSARKVYLSFSAHASHTAHRAFWRDIADDEKRHITYWQELCVREAKGDFLQVFDQPEKTESEIKAMMLWIDTMLRQEQDLKSISHTVITAFRLESLMLHPAFCILFSALKGDPSVQSPEEDYQEHVDKFSQFIRENIPKSVELRVMGEMLSRMWEHSRELAHQFAQIKTLQGLIPICANCKKIRDDTGFWNQIESYLEQRTDAQFTHGICPQCAQKLYPGLRHKG